MSRHGRSPNLGIHRARLISRGPLGEFQASRSPRPSSPRRSVCLASPRPSALLINNRGSCPDVDVITGPFCLLPIRVFFPLVFFCLPPPTTLSPVFPEISTVYIISTTNLETLNEAVCTGRRVKSTLRKVPSRRGTIVVVETNAARGVKFAKQMPLVDAAPWLSRIDLSRGNHVSLKR